MSKNFELLQQMGREQEVFAGQPDTAVEPTEIKHPQSHLEGAQAEEVAKMVQRVFLMSSDSPSRVVVFSSADAGSGCTWICHHASEILASQVNAAVCVVDANLGSPCLHERFGIANHYGLSDALQQPGPVRKFASAVAGTNLWLLSGGSAVSNWQTLLTSDRGRERLKELRAEFEYVLIDTPALSQSSAAMILGGASDGAVLVLKANVSRREVARKLIDDLKTANVQLLGAVLNQRTFPIPENIYNKL